MLRNILAAWVTIAMPQGLVNVVLMIFYEVGNTGVIDRLYIVVEDKAPKQQKTFVPFDWRLDVRGDIEKR